MQTIRKATVIAIENVDSESPNAPFMAKLTLKGENCSISEFIEWFRFVVIDYGSDIEPIIGGKEMLIFIDEESPWPVGHKLEAPFDSFISRKIQSM